MAVNIGITSWWLSFQNVEKSAKWVDENAQRAFPRALPRDTSNHKNININIKTH